MRSPFRAVVLLGNQLPMPRQQGCRRDDCRDLFQDFSAELLRPCCKTATLVVSESHPPVPNLFSKDAVLFDEIFDDVMLVLVHPARDGNDQKLKWIQAGSHCCSLSRPDGRLFDQCSQQNRVFGYNGFDVSKVKGYFHGNPYLGLAQCDFKVSSSPKSVSAARLFSKSPCSAITILPNLSTPVIADNNGAERSTSVLCFSVWRRRLSVRSSAGPPSRPSPSPGPWDRSTARPAGAWSAAAP